MATGQAQPHSKNIFPVTSEIPLQNPPLETVVCQIRFETILSIQNQANLGPFQEAIRKLYPIFNRKDSRQVTLQPGARFSVGNNTQWVFASADEKWKVTLLSNSIALDTSDYKSRTEFIERFSFVLEAFSKQFRPSLRTRIGVRYINRLRGEALKNVKKYIAPTVLGIYNSDIPNANVSLSVNETLFQISDRKHLLVRSGLLAPNSTIEGNMIKPEKDPSWILDIDASNSNRAAWDTSSLSSEMKELAEQSYGFFRWAVTNEFITGFGGKVD